ncbi:MAG: hypothetical protein ACOZHQ_03725 [Thermodesulfobacteriota bacterium]
MSRRGGWMSMEALALVSALCILGIFVFAHYTRQADGFDLQAQRLAREARPVVEAFFRAEPAGHLSLDVLKERGLIIPPDLQAAVTPLKDLREDWRLEVWHPEGNQVFVLTPAGISAKPR